MHKDKHNLAIGYQSFSKYAGPPFIATAIFAQRNSQAFAAASIEGPMDWGSVFFGRPLRLGAWRQGGEPF